MIMSARVHKLALTGHIALSVGLLGSIAVFLALALSGLASGDRDIVRACYLAMELATQAVIVPLALGSLLTGVIQSLGTAWGLFRHYWVVAKLVVTAFAVTILLAKLPMIEAAASLAAQPSLRLAELRMLGGELALHAAAGLAVLLVPTVLSVYKPRGLTPYGRRTATPHGSIPAAPPMARAPGPASSGAGIALAGGALTITLRAGHVAAIAAGVLIVHAVALHLIGGSYAPHG